MTRTQTVTIEDTLTQSIDNLKEEITEDARGWIEDAVKEEDADYIETLVNNFLEDDIHEYVDGAVPIYYGEIEDAWYLYHNELEAAYENAGIGENPRENSGMTAIYYYLMEEITSWIADEMESWEDAAAELIEAAEEI